MTPSQRRDQATPGTDTPRHRIWTGVEVCECGHYKFVHEGNGTCGSWRPRNPRGKRCSCQKFTEAKP